LQIRSISSILLRRMALSPLPCASGLKHSPWTSLDEATRSEIKGTLLKSLVSEKNEAVLHKICDTVAEIARTTLLTSGNFPFNM
jgi:hypothetical protein